MPSDQPRSALLALAYHIDLANRFVNGLDYEAFKDDLRTLYAVTRCLEIISEASRPLPSELRQRPPAIP